MFSDYCLLNGDKSHAFGSGKGIRMSKKPSGMHLATWLCFCPLALPCLITKLAKAHMGIDGAIVYAA